MAYINNNNVYIKSSYTNKYFLSLYNIENISDFYKWFDLNIDENIYTKSRIFETSIVEFYKIDDTIILSDTMNIFVNEKNKEIITMLFPYFKNNLQDYYKYIDFIKSNLKLNNHKLINSYIVFFNKNKLNTLQYFLIITVGKSISKILKKIKIN